MHFTVATSVLNIGRRSSNKTAEDDAWTDWSIVGCHWIRWNVLSHSITNTNTLTPAGRPSAASHSPQIQNKTKKQNRQSFSQWIPIPTFQSARRFLHYNFDGPMASATGTRHHTVRTTWWHYGCDKKEPNKLFKEKKTISFLVSFLRAPDLLFDNCWATERLRDEAAPAINRKRIFDWENARNERWWFLTINLFIILICFLTFLWHKLCMGMRKRGGRTVVEIKSRQKEIQRKRIVSDVFNRAAQRCWLDLWTAL